MATKGKTPRSNTTRNKPAKATRKKAKVKRKTNLVESKSEAIRPISQEERHRMIAEAAFKRAVSRNFKDADPVGDWLAAEREIDQKLVSGART